MVAYGVLVVVPRVERDGLLKVAGADVNPTKGEGELQPVRTAVPLSLRRNFVWTFVGNVVYAGCQWAMLVVLAKLGSPVQVGQYSIGLAVTAPIIMLANLQLRGVQATDARDEYTFGQYLSLRLVTTCCAFVIISTIALLGPYQSETAWVIFWIGLAKAAESISDIYFGLFQLEERMDRISRSLLIKGPLSLAALGGAVYLTGRVSWGAACLALAWVALLLTYDARVGRVLLRTRHSMHGLRPRRGRKVVSQLAVTALPLGLVMGLISLNSNLPRYFLEQTFGERELGIFSAIAYLMVAGNTVVGALGQSASPRLAKQYAAGDVNGFRRLVLHLVGVGLVLGLGGLFVAWIAGSQLLTLLYDAEYGRHADVFVLSMIAAGVGYASSFLGYAVTAARYFRAQVPLFAIVTLTLSASCYWLVPSYGLRGASWAVIIGTLTQAVGSAVIVWRAFQALTDASPEGAQK